MNLKTAKNVTISAIGASTIDPYEFRKATFNPARVEDLREDAAMFVGNEMLFRFAWHDDYTGEPLWVPVNREFGWTQESNLIFSD